MIFPDKPRPPWQYAKPNISAVKVTEVETPKIIKEPKPKGYYKERIEFALIVVGMYFWIQYWSQYA